MQARPVCLWGHLTVNDIRVAVPSGLSWLDCVHNGLGR